MLREWSVAEQRYRAVLEVLDGASVTDGGAAVRGDAGRPCMPGCAGMPRTAGW